MRLCDAMCLVVMASVFLALLPSGCACDKAPPRTRSATATTGDDSISLIVNVATVEGSHGPCVRCEVIVRNTSDHELVLFNDRKLPHVVGVPTGTADVFFGMNRMPDYGTWFTYASLGWRLLLPDEEWTYVAVLWNPLDEKADYGNPWTDDPGSPHFIPYAKRDPCTEEYDPEEARKYCYWRRLRVRVGYLDFTKGRPLFDLEKEAYLREDLKIVVGETERLLIEHQRVLEVNVEP